MLFWSFTITHILEWVENYDFPKIFVSTLGAKTSAHGDADSELLLMELLWRFQGQKFGNSIALFDLLAQKSQKGTWNSEFRNRHRLKFRA